MTPFYAISGGTGFPARYAFIGRWWGECGDSRTIVFAKSKLAARTN